MPQMKACDTEKANGDEKAIDHMYTLSNSQLTLHILDPVDDEDRLGTRYVSGCYVYQVTDAVHGDLLAGPAFAQEHPPVYHGQGMPEAFRNALGDEEGVRLILGNSLVSAEPDPEQMNTSRVHERCQWSVEQTRSQVQMVTQQSLGDWSATVERRVVLNERGVLSETRVTNKGTVPLPLVWYAHPFFPWPQDDICCSFSFDTSIVSNPGFHVSPSGQILRKPAHDWEKGQFVQIEGCEEQELRAQYFHPVTGQVVVQSDFELSHMPIWGNACTVSFEPYMERELATGVTFSWSLIYTF
jgi:hypothetical protein